jgi:hypothetical protein
MAATEKNNTDLPLLVGKTMMDVRGGWWTNRNADACPSDCGLPLGPNNFFNAVMALSCMTCGLLRLAPGFLLSLGIGGLLNGLLLGWGLLHGLLLALLHGFNLFSDPGINC